MKAYKKNEIKPKSIPYKKDVTNVNKAFSNQTISKCVSQKLAGFIEILHMIPNNYLNYS